MVPRECPFCCSTSVERILRNTLLTAHVEGFACHSTGVIAYHCSSGHVFLVVDEDFMWKESIPEINGSSMLV